MTLVRADPPLGPSGDDGRDQLRRELLHPEYHRGHVYQQVLDWVGRRLHRGLDAAHDAPPLSTLAAMAVFVALALTLAYLASRTRRTASTRSASHVVLGEERVTARQLRDRARTALVEGRYAEAVVEGFRALAVGQVERGLLPDEPGTTAHEVSVALGAELPAYAARVAEGATLFDAVRYGARPATREQAERVLALDDELTGARR